MRIAAVRWVLPLALAGVLGVGAAMAATAKHSSAPTLRAVKNAQFGMVLVNSKGMTLYRYTPDKKGKSVCSGACIAYWPPYLAKGTAKLTVGPGLKAGLLGTITRSNGAKQISYAGFPLYTYVGDSTAGATKGQGFEKTWYVVNTSGALVKKAGSSTVSQTTPATTTSKDAWG
jgi:predicted lipoprotein with Yx(FWY)xxD motif